MLGHPFLHVYNLSGQECVCVCLRDESGQRSPICWGKVRLWVPTSLRGEQLKLATKLWWNLLRAHFLTTIWPRYFLLLMRLMFQTWIVRDLIWLLLAVCIDRPLCNLRGQY